MGTDKAAADVFALLSDETRVDVLRAVAVAQCEEEPSTSGPVELTFSEIYERVDVDNTSKLSYHLGELAGPFLRKTDGGYSFTHAGEYVVRFVLSENYGTPTPFGPVETDGRCPFCGSTDLEAELFEHRFFFVRCRDCERPVVGMPTTPAQTRSWDGEELVDSMKRKQASQIRLIRRGVCPTCSGSVSVTVRAFPENPVPGVEFMFVSECDACLRGYSMPLPYAVVYHPASVAFHWDRGVDVTEQGIWEFHDHHYEDRWTTERRTSDPDEYEVVLRCDGDAIRFVVDATATVVRSERVRRAGGSSASQ